MTTSPHYSRSLLSIALLAFALATGTAQGLTVIPPTWSELVAKADTVVRSEVLAVRCEWRTAPDGKLFIRTMVTLKIEATIKGSSPEQIELEQLGGRIGSEALMIPGLPEWHVGDRDYLFIEGNGKAFCPLVGVPHGRYWIVKDGTSQTEYVARTNGAALCSTADVVSPLCDDSAATRSIAIANANASPLTSPQFEDAVRAELNRQTTAAKQ